MLGPIARQYMFKGYEIGSVLYHVPYRWDRKTRKVYESDSKLRKILMYNNIGNGVFGVIYISCMTFYMSILKEEDPTFEPFYMMGMVMAISLTFPLALQLSIVRTSSDLIEFHYQFIEFAERFQDDFVEPEDMERQNSKKYDQSGIFIASLYYLGMCIPMLIGLIIAFNPSMPLLITGHWDFFHWTLYWSFHVIQSVGITIHCYTWFGNQFLYAFPGLEYVFGLIYVLEELQLHKESYRTYDSLRRPDNFIKTYRALEILHNKAMYLFSDLVLPTNQWCYLFSASYLIYCSVKMEGLVRLAMLAGATIIIYYLGVAFTSFAKIHDASVEALHSWERQTHMSPWIKKTIKTFEPISVWVGGYYYCDQTMVITMFQSIMEGTVDLFMVG